KGWWETPRLPVQTYDWITPIMAPNLNLPSNRAKRFRDLINHFHCPSQKLYRAVVYSAGQQKCPDKKDFDEEPNGWIPLSFLMPVQFQFWGTNYAEGGPSQLVIGSNKNNPRQMVYAATAPRDHSWEADHRTYKSRLTEVGNASQKVMAADGTR